MTHRLIKSIPTTLALALSLSCAPFSLNADDGLDRDKILKAVDRIIKQQDKLNTEVERLRELLGYAAGIEGLKTLEAPDDFPEKLKEYTETGIKAYKEQEFETAKDAFQQAWELDFEHHVTNYNLALTYQKLGMISLSKQKFKEALKKKEDLDNAEAIKAFIEEKDIAKTKVEKKKTESMTEEELTLRTEIINLQKQADSYMKSANMDLPIRTKLVIHTLEEIEEKIKDSKLIKREFNMAISDAYAAFEWYKKALSVLNEYEKAMHGEVLPNGYHSKKLQFEEKAQKQSEELASQILIPMTEDLQYKLQKDIREIEIFGSQMQEFVTNAVEGNEDFDMICKRLREYRWGNQQSRHVIVVNRFQELLYSSLPGTLPLSRYRDNKGRMFLKNITFFPKESLTTEAKFFDVDLNINGKVRPYVVIYTYVPAHEAFIIVRLPKDDLS